MAHPFLEKIIGTCWATQEAGVYKVYSLTLGNRFLSWATLKLGFIDQIDRFGPDVGAQYLKNGLLLRAELAGDVYFAHWHGESVIHWKSSSGKTQLWQKRGCWPDDINQPVL